MKAVKALLPIECVDLAGPLYLKGNEKAYVCFLHVLCTEQSIWNYYLCLPHRLLKGFFDS